MVTRHENVRLSYHSNLARGLSRDAAAAALLGRELTGLNRRAGNLNNRLPSLTNNVNNLGTALGGINGGGLNGVLNQGGNQLDRYSGRLALLGQALAVIGPAAIPIGAVAIPAVTGLASQLGFAAAAGGTAMLAFQGVGDALDTMRTASLEPTVDNLQAAQAAMEKLSPAAREFVRQLRSMSDTGRGLRFAASEGMFPGLTDAFEIIDSRGPQVERILFAIGDAVGDLARRGAASLSSGDWDDFFDFIEREARPSLEALGVSLGNTVHALGQLWIAFGPLNSDFSSWMVDASRAFDDWATGLSRTEGFADFVEYVRTVGPQVADTMAAVGRALLDIAEAAAPLGGPVLAALEAIAQTVSVIASSDVGTELIALAAAASLFARLAKPIRAVGTALTGVGVSAASARAGLMSLNTVQFAAVLAGIYGINAAFEKLENNDIEGSDLTRGLEALADGRWTGNLEDIGGHLVNINAAMAGVNDVMSDVFTLGIDKSGLEDAEASINALDEALATLVEGGKADQAAAAFDQIVAKGVAAGVSAEDAKKHFTQYALALENLGPAADSASSATSGWTSSQSAAARAAAETKAEILGLVKAMEEQRDAALAGFDAETQWRQALKSAHKAAAENSAGIRGNSEAALANRGHLSDLAAAWNNQADAVRNNVGRFREARRSFIETAVAMGVPRTAAIKLADAVLEIPEKRVVQTEANTSEAMSNIAAVRARLDALNGRTATTYVITRHQSVGSPFGTAANPTLNALGGMYRNNLRTYARGGMDRANQHQPEMARPTMRIWAEPETQGESYIPWANDHRRPRAKSVLERTAGMFGGQVQWFASGGSPELEAFPVGPSGGKRMPPRLPGRQPASVLVSGASGNSGRSPASRGFNIGSLGVSETREELREFRRAIRESGKHLDKSFGHLSKRAISLSRQYEKSQATLERLRGRAADVRSAARGAFDNDPFGGSLSDFRTQLDADRNDTSATTRALRKAGRRGLSGPLAAALAGSGNRALAEQFAGLSRAEIAREERRFAQRTSAQSALGSAAVDVSGLSASIDRQVRTSDRLIKRMDNLERRIENAVERGAQKGTNGAKKNRDRLIAVAVQGGRR